MDGPYLKVMKDGVRESRWYGKMSEPRFTFNKNLYVVDDFWSKWEKGTRIRRYTGHFIICEQCFFRDGTIFFEFFGRDTKTRLETFNRMQMNEITDLMGLIKEHKKELYPEEYL